MEPAALLGAAIARRAPSPPEAARRWLDGRVEGLPGWTVDRYGVVALVQAFGAAADAGHIGEALADAAMAQDGILGVVLKERGGRGGGRAEGVVLRGELPPAMPADPFVDRPGRFAITESGLRLGIDLLYGVNTGLFLDARPLRSWVASEARDLSVLNLFSYTAAFGVAAASGGAQSTTNVDLVPSAIERGKANYSLNGLPVDTRGHVRDDVFTFLRRASQAGTTWDLVIVDPPPVPTKGRGRRGRGFDPRADMERTIAGALSVCADRGRVLAVSAARGEIGFEDPLDRAVAAEPRIVSRETLARAEDFPGEDGVRAVVLRLGET